MTDNTLTSSPTTTAVDPATLPDFPTGISTIEDVKAVFAHLDALVKNLPDVNENFSIAANKNLAAVTQLKAREETLKAVLLAGSTT